MTSIDLGEIGPGEIPVAQLIVEVHLRFCGGPTRHDPGCNTLRLLAADQAQLAARLTQTGSNR